MAKFLIGTLDGKVRSAHSPPLDFSISGRYVVDVPDDIAVDAATDSLSDLLHEKVLGFKRRPAVHGLTFSQSDELLSVPNVDPALSDGCFIGPHKRCSIMPGGSLVTNLVPIEEAATSVYLHWYGFSLWVDQGPQPPDPVPSRPAPPRLLYNYDPVAKSFVEFDPGSLTVEIWDSSMSELLLAVEYETVQSFSFGPDNVRLKFTNESGSAVFLSDWILLHDLTIE